MTGPEPEIDVMRPGHLFASMRGLTLSALIAGGLSLSITHASEAFAQVTTSDASLDALPQPDKAAPPHKAHSAHSHHSDVSHSAKNAGKKSSTAPDKQAATASTPAHKAPAATIPAAPPPVPELTPPPQVEIHPFPMPADPAIVDKAEGAVIDIPGGTRITFAADSADLNAATHAAVVKFADSLKSDPSARAILDISASGSANDESRPRRLALMRGLAARAILMNAGIPSTRIYVRVGSPVEKPSPETPADRVDMRLSDALP